MPSDGPAPDPAARSETPIATEPTAAPETVGVIEQPAAGERHLHPLSWLFIATAWLKSFVLPALIFLVLSNRESSIWSSYEIWSLAFVMPIIAMAVIKFWVVRYTLAPGELVVRDGILVRNERHVPYGRIQNIDLVQNPVHRMLGVALVRLETASGSEPEAVLRVLSLEAVDEMREHVFGNRAAAAGAETQRSTPEATSSPAPNGAAPGTPAGVTGAAPGASGSLTGADPSAAAGATGVTGAAAEADAPLLHMSTRELVKLGLISNRGFVVVAAALGIFSQFQWWEWVDLSDLVRNPSRLQGQLNEAIGGQVGAASAVVQWLQQRNTIVLGIAFVLALLVLFLVLLRAFSVTWHLITLHDYTLRRRGHDLRADYGLFTRVSQTIPTPRIQLLSSRQSPLHRWFDTATVQVETAGGGGEGGEPDFEGLPKTQRDWLAPLIDADRVADLVRAVLPEIDLDAVEWRPIPARAWKRIFKESCIVLIPVVVSTTVFFRAWGLAVLAIGGSLAYAYARGYTRNAAFALTPRAILFRDGWLVRRFSAVRFAKTQTVKVQSSPFDRRHGMASLHVDTAGAGKVGHKIAIEYLEADDALAISRRLYGEAAHTEFRW